ncbi:MAG: hypothetical protein K9M08_12810 [Pirellula sp.]|jgi:hypothetical protein|nr:hypothetical protein [Pirellula sp.]MCY2980193.1 hypothetical protein [Planctomycetota bacterium]
MQSDDEMESRLDSLVEAIEAEDKEAIMTWIRGEQFTLVSLSNDEDSLSAMILETEEFPALVAFMSSEHAEEFVDSIADQIEGEEVDLFEVSGEDLLTPLAKEFGLLINPESDDAVMIEPALLQMESDE